MIFLFLSTYFIITKTVLRIIEKLKRENNRKSGYLMRWLKFNRVIFSSQKYFLHRTRLHNVKIICITEASGTYFADFFTHTIYVWSELNLNNTKTQDTKFKITESRLLSLFNIPNCNFKNLVKLVTNKIDIS
jgi:hypothetical protein